LSSASDVNSPSAQHNNGDLLLWALYTVGGAGRWVDVEEVYLAAFRLAPARLAWRTRPDLPNYKICARGLQDLENAKEPRYGGLLEKRGPHHRKLTLQGVTWCEAHSDMLAGLYGGAIVPSAAPQDDARRLRSVTRSEAFRVWSATNVLSTPVWELAELFRCLPDSSGAIWHSRLDEHALAARRNGRADVEAFLESVRRKVDEQHG
jgi:hypothetical protein